MEVINWGRNNYYITRDGKVFNKENNKYLKLHLNKGYYFTRISNVNEWKNIWISRELGKAFIPNPENKPEIDHINRDTKDNRLENLRWATKTEQNFNQDVRKDNKLNERNISKWGNSYRVRKMVSGKRITKYFNTLDKAIEYRNTL